MRPGTVALDPTRPAHVTTGDSVLELDVPAGAVSAGDVAAAGGQISLLVRQALPAAGGSAGGSGHFTFGTFLVQVLDASGHLAQQGLRQPVDVRLHVAGRAGSVDVGHTVVVVNRPLPPWVSLDPGTGQVPAVPGPLANARLTASTSPAAPVSRQRVALDPGSQTLSASVVSSGSSTTVSFDTVAPVATFGAPDVSEVNLSAGALTLDYPLTLPAGPGGLTPPLRLGYDSASVSDQHNVAGAAPWVGEGWHLSLGGIGWAERDIAAGCTPTGPCPSFTWSDIWQLVDGFGTKAELIPPNFADSTYYEDSNGTAITPTPIAWHTTPDTHARVVSYVGPNALPGMAANPPCFRVFLPTGIMEEFGCTPDSLQFYPQPLGPNAGLDYISSWLPDLITDPKGNQIHITYQVDTETGSNGASYPRDAVMATVEYDSPGCHNAQAACTGSAWAPLMRVSFQASHAVAHVAGSSCAANGSLRCDDPVDLSGSQGLAGPTVENTFVLNDADVQVRASGTAAWNTLRDYQFAYDQAGPSTITDPFSGLAQSTAGRLNLTRLTEIGADGNTALPSRSFTYSQQTQYYEDSFWSPAPAGNCGPSWNVSCNLWTQTYAGNSFYLTTASNGLGLQQTFGWQDARDNSWGAPTGLDASNPFICNGSEQTVHPCDVADDSVWSRTVLIQRSDGLVRLTQAGQGGTQTSTPVTGTYTYTYREGPVGDYWGDAFDFDVEDFYNNRFMGFTSATVGRPDGSSEIHHYPPTLGIGVFDPTNSQFTGLCTSSSPCANSPWWNPANAEHGRETELDRYNPDGSLVQVTKTQYQALCPSSGVTGDFAGQLISELDWGDFVAVCDVAPSQVDRYFVDGGSQSTAPHLATAYAHDAYGRVTTVTETSNDGGGPGSPTTIVRKRSFAWDDAVSATGTSATGRYLIDFPAFADVEDSSANRYQCAYTSYDGQANTTGQTSGLTLGEVTRSDVYTSCGTSANGFTPSGQISTTVTYDAFGNLVTSDDPDALAGSSAHLGCPVGSTSFTACVAYDGTFDTLPTSAANALNQRTATGYQAPASGTATGGFGLWPTSVTDANGQITTFAYDALGRPTGVTLPGEGAGLTTSAGAYTVWCSATGAQSPCVEIDHTQRLNATTTVTARGFYDGLGRLIETRTPAPGGQDVVRYAFFDPAGRLAFQSVPYFVGAYTGAPGSSAYSIPDSTQAGTTFTYDGLGRVASSTDALSHRTSTTYSMICGAAGTGDSACYRETLTVDPKGHQSGGLVDALGRTGYEQAYTGASSTTYAVYATGRYTYDFAGDLVQVLQPDGATRTSLRYDMAGRLTGTTDPDLGTQSYTYDQNGNLVQSVSARGAAGTVFVGYDGLNRPLWHNTQNSASGAYYSYSYDSTAGGNAGVGRLTGEGFSSGPLAGGYAISYDARGRQVATTETGGSASYPVQTGYDDAGNVVSQTYPDGETVTSSFTGQGWLSAVSTRQGSSTTGLLSGAAYSGAGGAFGKLTGASLDGSSYTFSASDDLLGRATDLKLTAASGGATLFDQSRTFDPAGNVATASTTLPAGTDNQAFCYDEQNRLTWAGSTGTPPCTGTAIGAGTLGAAQYTQSFTYDVMGRLSTGPLGSYTYGSGAHVHAATAVGTGYTASYDASGDMACRAPTGSTTCAGSSPNGAQLTYNNEGQLTGWQGGGVSVQLLYDCQGRRVAQQVTQGGAATTTVYVGGLEAITTSGTTTTTRAYYYAGAARIAMAVNGAFDYLASDELGSADVALSANGTVVASQLAAPYGAVRYATGTMPTDYGFTGQRADAASGLDYYGARYYDPAVAQFTSADTVTPGRGYNLWGLSRFAYTRGNPTTRTDPSGHDDFGGGDFGGGDFGGGDFGGGDFGGGDFGGGDFGGGDFGGGDIGSADIGSADFGSDTGSVDSSAFDSSNVDFNSTVDTSNTDTGSGSSADSNTGSSNNASADTSQPSSDNANAGPGENSTGAQNSGGGDSGGGDSGGGADSTGYGQPGGQQSASDQSAESVATVQVASPETELANWQRDSVYTLVGGTLAIPGYFIWGVGAEVLADVGAAAAAAGVSEGVALAVGIGAVAFGAVLLVVSAAILIGVIGGFFHN